MTHEELCERARRWLSGTRRCEPVFSNVASCREIPDAIGWSSCHVWYGSTVIECKTSRGDFTADRHKYQVYEHSDYSWRFPFERVSRKHPDFDKFKLIELPRMGDFRFFMCEPEVITEEMLDKHAPDHGLLYVQGARIVSVVRKAPRREGAMIDKDAEIRYLRFAIINRKDPFSSIPEENPTLLFGEPESSADVCDPA